MNELASYFSTALALLVWLDFRIITESVDVASTLVRPDDIQELANSLYLCALAGNVKYVMRRTEEEGLGRSSWETRVWWRSRVAERNINDSL